MTSPTLVNYRILRDPTFHVADDNRVRIIDALSVRFDRNVERQSANHSLENFRSSVLRSRPHLGVPHSLREGGRVCDSDRDGPTSCGDDDDLCRQTGFCDQSVQSNFELPRSHTNARHRVFIPALLLKQLTHLVVKKDNAPRGGDNLDTRLGALTRDGRTRSPFRPRHCAQSNYCRARGSNSTDRVPTPSPTRHQSTSPSCVAKGDGSAR